MFELKPLSEKAIPFVLEKAVRYRLLNESLEAESICLDVLEIDPDNQEALVMLLLALTDQFGRKLPEKFQQAQELVPRLADEYARSYYSGIICERRAKVSLKQGGPGSGDVAYDWFRQAMEHYDRAAEIHAEGSAEAILRWNTCARILNRNPHVVPRVEERTPEMLE